MPGSVGETEESLLVKGVVQGQEEQQGEEQGEGVTREAGRNGTIFSGTIETVVGEQER